MRLLAPFVLMTLFICDLFAQVDSTESNRLIKTSRKAKSMYLEVLGNSGLAFSLNYDMRLKAGHRGVGFRAGITQPIQEGRAITHSFPLLLNYVNSDHQVALEAGAGFLVAYRRWTYEDSQNVIHHERGIEYPAVANLGVRFQPIRTGIVWRLYWAPTWRIGGSAQNTQLRWFGTSLGIGFN